MRTQLLVKRVTRLLMFGRDGCWSGVGVHCLWRGGGYRPRPRRGVAAGPPARAGSER